MHSHRKANRLTLSEPICNKTTQSHEPRHGLGRAYEQPREFLEKHQLKTIRATVVTREAPHHMQEPQQYEEGFSSIGWPGTDQKPIRVRRRPV